ncbi:NAD-binding protein [Kitasatospora atroaurantiaca]|uniref:Trk K+ transport system NAD-binding subunit n=1 Tax=Kitasatospora atroaurantiaca TaxID=285545 RepID=A0A561EZT0_9ACTN|nr:Trk K+ transport system NAD-binding subunit [Kitasatospora atroaurantiaca]
MLPGQQIPPGTPTGHMVICGGDALAHRLALELARLYGQRVTVVLPSLRQGHGPQIAALAADGRLAVTVVEAADLNHATLAAVGIRNAVALALTSEDDQANIHAGLRARRINPGLRLVIRVYNRRLGRRVEQLLDRAADVRRPGLSPAAPGASTTILSPSSTAAPALVAAALSGRSHVVHVDGRLLRVAEVEPGRQPGESEIATLALPAGPGRLEVSDELLPDPDSIAPEAGRVVLELLGQARQPHRRPIRLPGVSGVPLAALFSSRLRWALAGLAGLVALLAGLTSALTGQSPLHAAWLAVLDVLGIADPATDDGPGRKLLQILAAVSGMLLMPLLIALALEALGTFRTASGLRRPPRGLSGHVIVVGLGRVGSRVLDRLWELDVPIVCVDSDPTARGVARARAYGIPVVIGDATQDGVLEAAKIGRSTALITLTSNDNTNVETVLYARECNPEVRVVLRLFDDDLAGDIYRALRDSYPQAETRSRSVSFLAAPSFASAMMGREVLGAIAVGRRVLLVAAVEVAGNPDLAGRTVAETHRPGLWRVLAVALGDQGEPRWNPPPDQVLAEGDRLVVVATRAGLGQLLSSEDAQD